MAPHLKIMICALFASGANAIAKIFIKTEIDWLVYGLYSLTPEEIAVVEGRG